jgi:hypothetical protein
VGLHIDGENTGRTDDDMVDIRAGNAGGQAVDDVPVFTELLKFF